MIKYNIPIINVGLVIKNHCTHIRAYTLHIKWLKGGKREEKP